MLNRIVAREVTGANLRIQSIKASRGRVQIYATIGLSYYPFREENTKAIYDSIRAILPREYRKARLELYTDKHRIEELIPLAYRKVLPKRKKRSSDHIRQSVRASVGHATVGHRIASERSRRTTHRLVAKPRPLLRPRGKPLEMAAGPTLANVRRPLYTELCTAIFGAHA